MANELTTTPGASLSDIVTALNQQNRNLSSLTMAIDAFTNALSAGAGGISISATAGSATLPSNPVGFVSTVVSGAAYKIPIYGP